MEQIFANRTNLTGFENSKLRTVKKLNSKLKFIKKENKSLIKFKTMSKSSSKKFRWSLEFNTKPKSDLAVPPGFNLSAAQSHSEVARDTDQNQLIMKKSWDVALGPIKGIPMNLLIMYMAGNSISIFPIMMVGMSLIRPLKAIFTTGATFKSFELIQNSIIPQKLIFFLGNLVNIGLALYKCHSMGLLPTHASDWLAFAEPQNRLEFSDGGLLFI
ncbi:hypothetical protein ACKWTF_003271 [Chironomus riparius]